MATPHARQPGWAAGRTEAERLRHAAGEKDREAVRVGYVMDAHADEVEIALRSSAVDDNVDGAEGGRRPVEYLGEGRRGWAAGESACCQLLVRFGEVERMWERAQVQSVLGSRRRGSEIVDDASYSPRPK